MQKFNIELFLNQQFDTEEFTLPGTVGWRVIPGRDNTFFATISDAKTFKAGAIIFNAEGEIIDSIPIPYVERGGEPSRNGFASIEVNQNTFVVLGADATIYIFGPDGQDIIQPTTFNLKGQIWTTPILSAINDKEFYIIVPTDSMYYEGGQSKHDIYIYAFIYNAETKTLDFASANQPIFKRDKVQIGRDDPALCGNLLFFTVTYNNVNYSEIYAIDIRTGEVKKGWPQPLGLFSTTGPVLFEEGQKGNLGEIAAGTIEKVGERTFYSFLPDGTQAGEPYQRPENIPSALICTDVNGDPYPDILVVTYKGGEGIKLVILDGKTKKPIEEVDLGTYFVQQIITADLNADGLIETIYRTQTVTWANDQFFIENKVVILHLDKEGHVVDSETEEISLAPGEDDGTYGPLSIVKIGNKWVLVVGADYVGTLDGKPHYFTHMYHIELGGDLSIENMWPMKGNNLLNTSCLFFVSRFIPPPPEHFKLSQNYPNPFGEETRIPFALPEAAYVEVTIYNILGQRVRTLVDEQLPAGYHERVWDGKDEQGQEVASGVYFYRSSINNATRTKKMIRIR